LAVKVRKTLYINTLSVDNYEKWQKFPKSGKIAEKFLLFLRDTFFCVTANKNPTFTRKAGKNNIKIMKKISFLNSLQR